MILVIRYAVHSHKPFSYGYYLIRSSVPILVRKCNDPVIAPFGDV